MIVAIRAAYAAGNRSFRLDEYEGKPVDMLKAGIVEPLRVKTQASISGAGAVVLLILLRINDVIACSNAAGPAWEYAPGRDGRDAPGMGDD